MKKNFLQVFVFLCLIFVASSAYSQQTVTPNQPKPKSEFWKKVRFGSGLGLGFGNGFTNITLAPSAVYDVNKYFSAGLGVQYSYLKQKDLYSSSMYGGSLITLFNPLEAIQLSAELEQLKVSVKYDNTAIATNDFWNTALFLGAGYRTQNVTIGARYNVLYDDTKGVYGSAWMPFVRMYF